jgi:hypothetical protein
MQKETEALTNKDITDYDVKGMQDFYILFENFIEATSGFISKLCDDIKNHFNNSILLLSTEGSRGIHGREIFLLAVIMIVAEEFIDFMYRNKKQSGVAKAHSTATGQNHKDGLFAKAVSSSRKALTVPPRLSRKCAMILKGSQNKST